MNRYIARPHTVYRAGKAGSYVITPDDGRVTILPTHLVPFLQSADRARSLKEHAEDLLRKGMVAGEVDSLIDGFQELADRKLILPVDELIGQPKAPTGGAAEKQFWLTWPTRNRPQLLDRSIRSWFSHSPSSASAVSLLICDDSDKNQGVSTREVCQSIGRTPPRVVYFGPSQRRALLDFFVRRGIPESPVRFALFDDEGVGEPTKINHNAALLLTAGRPLINTDDDTVFDLAGPLDRASGTEISSLSHTVDVNFSPTRSTLLSGITKTTVSPLRLFAKVLGRPISDWLNPHDEADAADISGFFASHLPRFRPGEDHVLLASLGSFGHSGMPSSWFLLALRHRFDHVFRNNAEYLAAMESSEMFRVARRLTITLSPTFMDMSFACDNRRLLPPYFPVMRSMDGVWGITCALVDPSGTFAHLPIALYHDPGYPRPALRSDATTYNPKLAEYLRIILLSANIPLHVLHPAARLKHLGEYLTQISGLEWSAFEVFFKERWVEEVGGYIGHLERLVDHYRGSPTEWAADVRCHIDSMLGWIESPDLPLPSDLTPEPGTRQSLQELLQRLFRRYGELLTVWPEMRRAAEEFDLAPYEV